MSANSDIWIPIEAELEEDYPDSRDQTPFFLADREFQTRRPQLQAEPEPF
jgi:hypothetical protein